MWTRLVPPVLFVVLVLAQGSYISYIIYVIVRNPTRAAGYAAYVIYVYDSAMAQMAQQQEWKVISLPLTPRQLERIENFRFRHRFPTRLEAVRWLIEAALDAKMAPEREERS